MTGVYARHVFLSACLVVLCALVGCQSPGGQAADFTTKPEEAVSPALINPAAVLAELETIPVPDGVMPDIWEKLTAELARVLAERATLPKAASAPPTGDGGVVPLSFNAGLSALEWLYANPGDYDQNGVVAISDLTPLGVHFGEESPNGIGNPWPDTTEEWVVNGDQNGVINLGDVTVIGANFGTAVEGYRVYYAQDSEAVPLVPNDPDGPGTTFEGMVTLGSAKPGLGRITFERQITPTLTHLYYWVRPFYGNDTGAASSNVLVSLEPNQPPEAQLIPTGNTETMAHIIWDASGSVDPDGQIVSYEWDFDDDGVYEHVTTAPTVDFYYYEAGNYGCRLRITDDGGLTDGAMRDITITEDAAWHHQQIDTVIFQPEVHFHTSHLLLYYHVLCVNDQPVIVYTRSFDVYNTSRESWFETVYLVATDGLGEVWEKRISLPCGTDYTQSLDKVYPGLVLATLVDSHPALLIEQVSLDDAPSPYDKRRSYVYGRSTDAAATSWLYSSTLALYDYGHYADPTHTGIRLGDLFLEINAAPVVFGESIDSHTTAFTAALDQQGKAWPDNCVVTDSTVHLEPGLSVAVNNRLATIENRDGDILYYRNQVDGGLSWSDPVVVDYLENAVSGKLINADGKPAVVYYDDEIDVIKLRRATTADGLVWNDPVVVTDYAHNDFTVAMVDNRPAVLYEDRVEENVKMIAANNPEGTHWGFPIVVEPDDSGFIPSHVDEIRLADTAGNYAFAGTRSYEVEEDVWGVGLYFWSYH